MLKHSDSEAEPLSAAKVRVTPEEFAAAIARLEAGQEASRRHQDGTVAIGEVVDELGLQTTPEEVLAEVQAERARQTGRQKRRLTLRERLGFGLGLGAVILGLASLWSYPHAAGTESGTIGISPAINVSVNTDGKPQTIGLNPNLLVSDASGKLVLLSEVADNQPVHCRLVNSSSFCSFEQYLSGIPDDEWTLIKHGGQVYVRGWILRMSDKVFQANGIDVSAHQSAPDYVVPITLPINNFQVVPGPGNDILFHAQNIHLDKYAWEKW